VFYYLFSSKGQKQILSDFRGATVGGISRNFPVKVNVPIPPLTEQEQIVSELERHLSVADTIEATIGAELTRAERLRQSILKHAFSGKLVPQDPNDEPASVLLEKIRDEKEEQQPKRKRTPTKSKIASSAKQLSLPLD
jgi:type I restriction enzyme S subunit